MLNENIKTIRKSKGLSQEELATKINVVRQTVSKWEQGISIPDAETLILISEALDTSVSTLIGENITDLETNELNAISEKLENINLQLAKTKAAKRKVAHWSFIVVSVMIIVVFVIMFFAKSPYLNWDFSDPEMSIVGTILHGFEFAFVRVAPITFIGTVAGAILTRKKN